MNKPFVKFASIAAPVDNKMATPKRQAVPGPAARAIASGPPAY